MPKIIVRDTSELANSVYRKFKNMEGSYGIASLVAIEALVRIFDDIKPKTILEIGGGLGTITYTIMGGTNAVVDVTEPEEFCASQFVKNLSGFENRYRLFREENADLLKKEYDLIIVDGGCEKFIRDIFSKIESVKIVFIEGNRPDQWQIIRSLLKKRFIFSLTDYKDASHVKGRNEGHRFVCKKSNNSLLRFFNYWMWEILILNSILAFLSYRTRLLIRKFV